MNATSGRSRCSVATSSAPTSIEHQLVAERDERVLDPRAAAHRDLALQATAALEDRDLHSARAPEGTTEPSADPAAPGREAEEAGGTLVMRLVELDLLGDHGADPADALADLVRRRGREVEPHRRAAAAVDVGGRAGDEGDVLAQRLRKQVRGVDVGGQRRPAEQPPAGTRPAGALGEVGLQRIEHRVAPLAVDVAEVVDVLAPAALGEVLADEVLGEGRRAEVGGLLAEHDLLHHRRRRAEPAEPDPRREDLRQRPQVEHVVAPVELVERLVRLALVAQQAVGIVLDHEQLPLPRQRHQPRPPLRRHRHARRGSGSSAPSRRTSAAGPSTASRSQTASSSSIRIPSSSTSIWTVSAW